VLDLVAFEPKHAVGFEVLERGVCPPTWDRGITLLSDGVPVAIFYLVPVAEGVLEVAALISPKAMQIKKGLHASAKAMLAAIWEQGDIRRVQATVDAECRRAIRWIEALGFRYEGCLRGYGPGAVDHLMYGRAR
jgi:RimJ/RimL family protein N-acetyltransferase